ncbi:sugar phosphate isomerase/epimerase family protein [Mariluticola halotolerans]|uniref:sugar phosphate isomerase/epimerase family protein n=1 Tax=Mariluticola halotolerans TaxID=2909283 RepID=UPI0026E25D2A|nr:TIM barrel protein [Mariluticola halotolerans]UJQ94105.1 sugar phosphate isomerase/epimerase [Mariluticola halotolerans]
MRPALSLAFLTTFEVGPVDAVKIAAETGYDMVGLRLLPAAASGEGPYPIMSDKIVQDEVYAVLRDTGVKLADVEIVRLGANTLIDDFKPFCALAEKLGARHVLVAGDDPEESRLTDNFAAFCALAQAHKLTADLEFMPWTAVKTLLQAARIVAEARMPNGGVLIDALHYDRAHATPEQIKSLPASQINYAQLCDGPVPYDPSDTGMIAIARGARLLPGHGGIGLVNMLKALPEGTPISIEVAEVERAKIVPAKQRAREALAASLQVLDQAGVL